MPYLRGAYRVVQVPMWCISVHNMLEYASTCHYWSKVKHCSTILYRSFRASDVKIINAAKWGTSECLKCIKCRTSEFASFQFCRHCSSSFISTIIQSSITTYRSICRCLCKSSTRLTKIPRLSPRQCGTPYVPGNFEQNRPTVPKMKRRNGQRPISLSTMCMKWRTSEFASWRTFQPRRRVDFKFKY